MPRSKRNKTIRYFGEIKKLPSGKYKVSFMQRLIGINQHRNKWVNIDKKEFTKEINNNHLIN